MADASALWTGLWVLACAVAGWALVRRAHAGGPDVRSRPKWRLRDPANTPAWGSFAVFIALATGASFSSGHLPDPVMSGGSPATTLLADALAAGMSVRALRLMAVVACTGALGYFYLLLHRRTRPAGAVYLLAPVIAAAAFTRVAVSDPLGGLALAALLGAHRSLDSALRGRSSMWARFALLATLTVGLQPLWIGYLLGYVPPTWGDRVAARKVAIALAPALLAVLPLAIVLGVNHELGVGTSARLLLLDGGVVVAAMLAWIQPTEEIRGPRPADDAIIWCVGFGLIGAVSLAFRGEADVADVLPVLPLAALSVASRMPRVSREWSSRDRMLTMLGAAFGAITILVLLRDWTFIAL